MSEEATEDEFAEERTEKRGQPEQKVPEDWQVHRADEIMEITRGASPRPKGDPELFGGNIPWVKIGDVDVKNARYTGETEDTVTEKGANKSKLVEENTLIVSNSGTCGYPMFVGRQSCVHDGWLILRDYEDSLNPYYLYDYINWKQNYLKSLAPGSTQINLNTSRFGVLEINTPPLFEQRKIAAVLYTVDRAIQKNEKLGDHVQRIKKGLMQDLLSGKVRTTDDQTLKNPNISEQEQSTIQEHSNSADNLNAAHIERSSFGDLPHEWSEERLRNLIKKDEAGVWGDEASGDGVRVLRATNYAPNSIDLNDVAVRDIPESKKRSKQLKPGDIVVERSGGSADQPVGRVLFFDLDGEYYHGSFLSQLRPDSSKINSHYLYYCLDYNYRRGHTRPLQANTTNIRNLQYSSYLNQTVPSPPLSEQRKIATVLQTVDRVILTKEKRRNQLQRSKKSLMQDLFSGTVRTTDTNIQVPDEILQHG